MSLPCMVGPSCGRRTRFSAALGQGSIFVSFLGDEALVCDACPAQTRDRLAAVKRRRDPDDLFRPNRNIPPADTTDE